MEIFIVCFDFQIDKKSYKTKLFNLSRNVHDVSTKVAYFSLRNTLCNMQLVDYTFNILQQ